jgi:hypothetical protein
VVIANTRLELSKISTESDENSTSEEANNMAFNAKAAREEFPTENGVDERNVKRFIEIVNAIDGEIESTGEENSNALVRIVKSALLHSLTSPTVLQTLLTRHADSDQTKPSRNLPSVYEHWVVTLKRQKKQC